MELGTAGLDALRARALRGVRLRLARDQRVALPRRDAPSASPHWLSRSVGDVAQGRYHYRTVVHSCTGTLYYG